MSESVEDMNQGSKSKWKLVTILGVVAFSPLLLMVTVLFCFFMLFFMIFSNDTTDNSNVEGEISSIGENEIPAEYIPVYRAAEAEYGVPWNLLAAHHRVETRFSTLENMVSPVGAIGHMQFMPLTWVGWNYPGGDRLGNADIPEDILTDPEKIEQYGGMGIDANGDGKADPWDIEDAIFSAASYLAKNGAATGQIKQAVFRYNHSDQYVADVLHYADVYVEGYESIEDIVIGVNGFARPLNTNVTSGFGIRVDPVTGAPEDLHSGIDFACNVGDAIPASKAGKVVYAGWQNPKNHGVGYGLYVWVEHGDDSKTTYAHLNNTAVNVGDDVSRGDVVGQCGSTGESTGPHLHFEIFNNGSRVDPGPYIGL